MDNDNSQSWDAVATAVDKEEDSEELLLMIVEMWVTM